MVGVMIIQLTQLSRAELGNKKNNGQSTTFPFDIFHGSGAAAAYGGGYDYTANSAESS